MPTSITSIGLILRGLRYHRRSHLTVACGTAVAAICLTGALLLGDSLRASLRTMVDQRLGRTHHVLASRQGFFSAALADSLASALMVPTAPIVQRAGIAAADGGRRRAHEVAILGVDERYRAMAPSSDTGIVPGDGEAAVNATLARALDLRPGDPLILRFDRGDLLPMEAPFAGGERNRASLRVRVRTILAAEQFGDFSLKAEHYAVHNVFVPLATLARACGQPGMATAVLVGKTPEHALHHALDRSWTPADAGIHVRVVKNGRRAEIHADRIFLDDSLVAAITDTFSDARPVFAYFVNGLRRGDRLTPYSFVSTPPADIALDTNEILLGRWTADDLGATTGDSITISYYVPDVPAGLREEREGFVVAGIVPARPPWTDSTLMPPFPGLSDAGSCTDWDPGTPIDLDLIRPEDEAYWERWRGTPKAFITLPAARRLWANRFGSCTAIRVPLDVTRDIARVKDRVRAALSPSLAGLGTHPIRSTISTSIAQGVSFAPLFTGLSFFVIAASAILTALLFAFSVQSRAGDYRYLIWCGFTRSRLYGLFLGEGLAAAIPGAVAGAALAPLYTSSMLAGLRTVWHAIALTPALRLSVRPLSLAGGIGATVALSCLAMAVSLHAGIDRLFDTRHSRHRHRAGTDTGTRRSPGIAVLCLAGAILFFSGIAVPGDGTGSAAGRFFGAGGLLLGAMLSVVYFLLTRRARRRSGGALSLVSLALNNGARRRGRTMATAALFACSLFILGAMSVFRLGGNVDPREVSSGTGGFRWYVALTTAVPARRLSAAYLHEHGLNDPALRRLPMRLREGDDASCFNLNRVSRPALVGVDAHVLDSIGCFSFATLHDPAYTRRPWRSLLAGTDERVVPGVADQSAIEWGMGKAVGDTLRYVNERGESLNVVLVGGLAGTLLQGKVLIDERRFIEQFPSRGGYRLLLVDTSPGMADTAAALLRRLYRDDGVVVQSAASRLASFTRVQNTYLSIFSLLGALGLMLGSAGLGVVIMRNGLERRREFAVLRAQGFTTATVRQMVTIEHLMIFGTGVITGLLASLATVLPILPSLHRGIGLGSLVLITGGVLACGVIAVRLASSAAVSGDVLSVLREE